MISLPRIIGHRGAAALAPENTLPAFRAAAAAGATWVELDVRLAADGLVVFHDATLERTTDGTGPVRTSTVDAIGSLTARDPQGTASAGVRVPTLDEALREIQRLALGVNVELKSDGEEPAELVEAVVARVGDLWTDAPERLLYSSFSREVVWALSEAAPSQPRGLISSRLPPDWRSVAEATGCVSIHLGWRDLSAAQVKQVGDAGYAVAVWTVNDRALAQRLRGWGVDSIITDDPAMMRDLD